MQRSIDRLFRMVMIVVLCHGALEAHGEEPPLPPCEGKYKDKKLSAEELTKVLANHNAWIQDVYAVKVKDGAPDERRANLCEALFNQANPQYATLDRVQLQQAYLDGANLQYAALDRAQLQYAHLQEADLQQAYLNRANLQQAYLDGANLQYAVLDGAQLQYAYLAGANLQHAHLDGAQLQQAYLDGAQLQHTYFESAADSLPVIASAARADGLSEITFGLPLAAVELREAFKKAGLREQQRQLTHAINYTQTRLALHSENIGERIEAGLRWLTCELPCQYGLYPGRPLRILGVLLLLFTIPYYSALTRGGTAGIWAI